jgi:hypothetical protein
MNRHFYALDLHEAISSTTNSCHQCATLKQSQSFAYMQSTSEPPEALGLAFAADVMRRHKQYILVVRESITAYTCAVLLPDEKQASLREAILCMCLPMVPHDGPPAVIRTDGAPGFTSLVKDAVLREHNICLEIGRPTNPNKNPVAERAIQELEAELRRTTERGERLSSVTLAIAVAKLNSRLRTTGLSAHELWYKRDQYTNMQLPISDQEVISSVHLKRSLNHSPSEKSKAHGHERAPTCPVTVGDIVYLFKDGDKHSTRDRYIVSHVDGDWCNIRRFIGSQLRDSSYRVKLCEVYKVPMSTLSVDPQHQHWSDECSDEELHRSLPSDTPAMEVTLTPWHAPPTTMDAHQDTLPSPIDNPVVPDGGPLFPYDGNMSSDDTQPAIAIDNPTSSERPRPQRCHKPPAYLEDYITDF